MSGNAQLLDECRRALEALTAQADTDSLRAEARRLTEILADPAH
nr:hypothetical protein GCM10010200_010210 [Actinomadura rugatobispora]